MGENGKIFKVKWDTVAYIQGTFRIFVQDEGTTYSGANQYKWR